MLGNIGFLLIAAGTFLVGEAYRERLACLVGSRMGPALRRSKKNDAINDASEESFPASDPTGVDVCRWQSGALRAQIR